MGRFTVVARGVRTLRSYAASSLCAALAATIAFAASAQAQRPARPPTPLRGGAGSPADTSVRGLNSEKVIFEWTQPDSTLRELLERKGYRQVQYQGDVVRFDARTRELRLRGKPSAVKRDQTMLIGDTIAYSDSTKRIIATGDTVILRDPTQVDADDFVARGRIDYDTDTKQGVTGAFATSVSSGQRLYLSAERSSIFSDSLVAGKHIIFAHNGSFTYCDHEEPHFHFTTKDMKFISENVMVARPGVLYIGEVPVFWIPFFFQDVRRGRRSGLLTPNFGIAELLRNSPSYRRSVQNMGYFFAINEYMNAEASFDWRSGARATDNDPGFLRSNIEYRYKWLNRFISGETAVSYLAQGNGTTNTSVTWNHNQDFSKQTRLTARLNWVQSTTLQRATTINPVAANATIRSQLSYQTKIGPAQINVGGSRVQYPGRTQVDMDFPSVNVTTGSLGGDRFTWTPALQLSVNKSERIDQGLQFPFVYNPRPGGLIDSSQFRADRRNMTFRFDTPLKLGDFIWQNSFSINEQYRNYPEQREIIGVRDTSLRSIRIFARTFETNADWTTSFNLPRFFQGSWNVSPSVSVQNVDGASGLFVRTERSGGQWVAQAKRLSYAVGASPTLYAQFPGLGPIARIRHSIAPQVSYSYSPQATVSDRYLEALGRTRVGYLGSLKQNRVQLGFNTVLEAKIRGSTQPVDTGAASKGVETGSLAAGGDEDAISAKGGGGDEQALRKLTLLSLQFSPLTYDFVRADSTGKGFTDRTFSLSGRTDLLPGLDFRTSYELFQGDPLSDTATFSPYRTDIGVTFSLNSKSGIFAMVGRLLGMRTELEAPPTDANRVVNANERNIATQSRQMNAAGGSMRGNQVGIPTGAGWSLNLQYNAARQRPPRGGTQIRNDPAALCESQKIFGLAVYDNCIFQSQNAPATGLTTGQSAIGAPFFLSPATQNVTSAFTFNITQNWSAQWSTQYDVERNRFASQQVGLQRQLHDWNAVFAFTQAPNGNFSFNFFIALKAQPELKFNYDRQTYRQSSF